MTINIKFLTLSLLIALMSGLSSCDDGKIYEKEYEPDTSGKVMKMKASITGMNSWSRGYSVVLAGFDDKSEYAIITKLIPFPKVEGEELEVVMAGIPQSVTNLHLCVINRSREIVRSYRSMECRPEEKDTIRMEGFTQDVNMYDAVQEEVFNSEEYGCIRCHGARESLAGGINLLTGKSYKSLISRPSGVVENALIVNPGNAKASTLYQILGTDFGSTLKYNHANILINSYADLALVKDWINNGANE